MTAPEGGDKRSETYTTDNNITSGRVTGTSRAYTLDRLSREAPGLYEAVCRKELSANAAAIQAGFRKRPAPFEQIKKLLPKLTPDERRKLKALRDIVGRYERGEISQEEGVAQIRLGKHGGDRRSESDQDRFPTLKTRGRDYDVARLRRDHPSLAEAVQHGARAARLG